MEAMFKNVEKIMRYLVPSFVLTILLKLSAGDGYFFAYFLRKISDIEFVIYFILSGVTIYSIHRLLWEIVDIILFKCGDSFFKWCKLYKDLANYIKSIYKGDKEGQRLRSYFYYKMATIHSVLIATEIAIVFFLLTECSTSPKFLTGLIIFFIFALAVYCLYYMVQKEAFKINDHEGD
jgi:hypothetical protein